MTDFTGNKKTRKQKGTYEDVIQEEAKTQELPTFSLG